MYQILLVTFLLISVGLVALIMFQQGKGADMGASFGSGTTGTLFGSSGPGNFITRMTAGLATLFFVFSLWLGNMNSNDGQEDSQWDNLSQPEQMDKAPVKPTTDIPQ